MSKERRKFERVESLISVEYSSNAGQIRGRSLTADVSEGGIGLPLDGKIPQGTRLKVEAVLDPAFRTKVPFTAKVAWSRKNIEHWKPRYSGGLRFLEIDAADKEALLGFARNHRWTKSDFERMLEADEVSVIDRRGVV